MKIILLLSIVFLLCVVSVSAYYFQEYNTFTNTFDYVMGRTKEGTFQVEDNINMSNNDLVVSTINSTGKPSMYIGTSDTNHTFYFYEDGSPTGETFSWRDDMDRFDFTDDIGATGSISANSYVYGATYAIGGGGIYTQSPHPIGNLWLGTNIQGNSKFIAFSNGNLSTNGNTSLGGFLHVGGSNALLTSPGNAYFNNRVLSNGSQVALASPFGVGMMVRNSGQGFNITSVGNTVTLNVTTQFICDSSNPFSLGNEEMFLTVLSSSPVNYNGATGYIKDFINSTCIRISFAAAGKRSVSDLTAMTYLVYNTPLFAVLDRGDVHFHLGQNPDTRFYIEFVNGTNERGLHLNDVAGTDNRQSLTVDMDGKGYDGVVGINSYLYSSEDVDGKSGTNLLLETDATNVNNSENDFISMRLIGFGYNNKVDALEIDPNVDHIIHMGSSDVINKSYYNDINITINVTNGGNDPTVFINDNDVLYIGSITNFTDISISLSTESSHNLMFTYQFCNSSGYYTLPGVTDTTNGFKVSGSLNFPNPDGRGICHNQTDGTPFSDLNNYTYIALTRTINYIVTAPVIDFVSISGGTDYFVLQKDMIKLQPTDSPETCDASIKGAIYYDLTDAKPYDCDGSTWTALR